MKPWRTAKEFGRDNGGISSQRVRALANQRRISGARQTECGMWLFSDSARIIPIRTGRRRRAKYE